jgi:hypothetical protein
MALIPETVAAPAGEDFVMTRNVNPPLFYRSQTPARWLRAAVAALDDQLAGLCLAQWQRMQPIRAELVVPLRPRRTERS